ncbi:conserved hypothetical protein [Rhodopseudomonas palustris HaA2]|uniref:Uncharacterized protein n=1 Tax=Rhodopseudomonas palustris (strain HaA2) TaxID=316058 RepID=Q2IWJ0_RHOP2|nr:hypothetical protein [Rhodopseudomonas palustris]ABD07420.1 conserved hypothetical protein [Rhodopseudomonas palustris HaA2]
MTRLTALTLAITLALLPLAASAASPKKHAKRAQSSGLPGYVQPPSNSVPLFMQKLSRPQRAMLRPKRPWYIDPTPEYYRWNGGWSGEWRYLGRPGFYRGRYNGGSFGPCWTQTPIGPVWNCG